METGLRDRPILVTGATGGIGAATVRLLETEGADVIAAGRNPERLSELAAETGCRTLSFDLTSEDEIRSAINGLDLYGVVNCGGWGGEIATPMETDISVFDKVIDVNTRGTLLVGHISYASSKGAVDAMTRVSALELGKHNIRVNAVNPTVVMTPMSEWYWGREDIGGPLLEAMPLHKWATEADCAGPIVFLLSDAAAMISGVCLPVDGGFTAV